MLVRTSIWNNKVSDGSHLFPAKGLQKVAGEFALFCLGYNLERAKKLFGYKKMMKLMEQA